MFQSTHPRGVRHNLASDQHEWFVFQSTHPRGVRLPIQQKAEYHVAKICILRKNMKFKGLKDLKYNGMM